MTRILLAAILVLTRAASVRGEPLLWDAFDDTGVWTASGSDGVASSVSQESVPDEEGERSTIRVDVEFRRGSGFAVFRRDVTIDLPENWALTFDVRGELPVNNFEVKLIDETGENVWWVNSRDFRFPRTWTQRTLKKRHFSFAWGPGGSAKPLERISAIEFAVTAGSGGAGTVWLDSLRLEEAPRLSPDGPVRITVSTAAPGREPPPELPADGVINWVVEVDDEHPYLDLEFGGLREIGGISIEWGGAFPSTYRVSLQRSARHISNFVVAATNGGIDHIPIADAEGSRLTVSWSSAAVNGPPVEVRRVRFRDVSFSSGANGFISAVATESPRGWFPRSFLDEQVYWTVTGAPDAEHEALISEDGAIELYKGGPTIEPFFVLGSRLLTWNDAAIVQRLEAAEPFPTPVVEWSLAGLTLTIRAFAFANGSTRGEYVIRNVSAEAITGRFALALRPFQVLPPTHDLNMSGGWSRCDALGTWDSGFHTKERSIEMTPAGWTMHASMFSAGESVEWLASGSMDPKNAAADTRGLASGAALRDISLRPGESFSCGFQAKPQDPSQNESSRGGGRDGRDARTTEPGSHSVRGSKGTSSASSGEASAPEAHRVSFSLPPDARRYADTFRSQVAYILINRDGPAIQPGSRSYDRTWIRDGALTSTALLYAGGAPEVREFLDWFAAFQYENGKIPCCADERGPDPVPEHDSHGQYIYAVAEYDRFVGDDEFLRDHAARVARAVDYIESLRARRMTDQYRNGDGLDRAKFGLMPESISHEGYSAKPMHSYWDDFWTLRGLEDAAYIGERIGDDALMARASAAAESMRACLYDSMRLAMSIKQIDSIPGCVELGDFDATSTSIGVFPVGEIGRIPEPELTHTFDRYAKWFEDRAAGRIEWEAYTPYEIRNATTFLLLGRRDDAHRMMDFFFKDQRPAGWHAWAEVVRNGYRTPGFIGDLPHTWVGSDFVKFVRTMFVHERGSDSALVIGMGIPRAWIEAPGGASASHLPTHYGEIGLAFFERDGARVVRIDGNLRSPPGGVEIALEGLGDASITADGRPISLDPAGRLLLHERAHEVVIRGGGGDRAP